MKNLFLLALAIVMPLTILTPAPVHAAATNIGFINANASDEFTNKEVTATGTIYDWAEGSLAGRTSILFTYMINPTTNSLSYFGGSPSSTMGTYEIPLTPSAFADNGPEVILGTFSSPGLFNTVISQTSDYFFTVLLSNISNQALEFATYLKIVSPTSLQTVGASWSSASIVPLPAALPLFGLGIVGLAGYKRIRKNKKEA